MTPGKRTAKSAAADFRPTAQQLSAARRVAAAFRLTLEQVDGSWIGSAVELPNVLAQAESDTACLAKTREALAMAVAFLEHHKLPVPRPCRTPKRDRQVNIRVTAEEKLALDARARAEGFRSASDFIRAAAFSIIGRRDDLPARP